MGALIALVVVVVVAVLWVRHAGGPAPAGTDARAWVDSFGAGLNSFAQAFGRHR